jgi:hypothetical protein
MNAESIRKSAAKERGGRALILKAQAGLPFWKAVAKRLGYRVYGWTWHLQASFHRPDGTILELRTEDGIRILYPDQSEAI